jgi:hypothetical protein
LGDCTARIGRVSTDLVDAREPRSAYPELQLSRATSGDVGHDDRDCGGTPVAFGDGRVATTVDRLPCASTGGRGMELQWFIHMT